MKKLLVYVGCCAVWVSTWSLIAVGLRDLPPFLFAGLRMLLAGALLLPLAWRELRARGGREVSWLAGVGLLQIALPYGLMFYAQQWTPTALTAVLFATCPLWLALFGRLMLGEALTPARLLALALGLAGVLVLQLPRLRGVALTGPAALAGALVVLSAAFAAIANVLLKRRGGFHGGAPTPEAGSAVRTPFSPPFLASVQALSGGVLLLAVSGLLERGRSVSFTPSAVGAIVYLAVFATALCYLGLYWLLQRVPLAVIGTIPLLDTTFAFAIAAGFLGEPITRELLAGGALVVGSAVIANVAKAPVATPAVRRMAA